MYAAHFLPRMGYAKRAHLMNGMVPGLSGGKMSASDPKSKIDFLDKPAEVKAKLKAALCTPGEVEGNGVLAFTRTVLFPIQRLRNEQAKERGESWFNGEGSFAAPDAPEGTLFSITRPEKFGGSIHFANYEELEQAYAKEDVHPGDLKGAVTESLNKLLGPIQKMFEADQDWQEAERMGYPSAANAIAIASAKQGAGDKAEAKVSQNLKSRNLGLI
jgi:tyrosyl-tRNA synthetase